MQFSDKKLLGEIESKYLDVADLLKASIHLRTLARLDDLPLFELSLAKKKKDKGKGADSKKNVEIDNKEDNKLPIQNDKDEKNKDKNDENKSKNIQNKGIKPENVQQKVKPEKIELSDPILTHFLKLKFVVGQISACESHQEADKLLIETINIGENTPRTVCSGIKAH